MRGIGAKLSLASDKRRNGGQLHLTSHRRGGCGSLAARNG